MTSRITCYVFDIDGTLADCSHRLYFITPLDEVPFKPDWDAFYDTCGDDAPIEHMVRLAQTLSDAHARIICATGRPERIRKLTADWLNRHFLYPRSIYMRADSDHRPDVEVKREMLDRMRADGWEPIMAFEDRDRVARMWRDAGIPCLQACEGTY